MTPTFTFRRAKRHGTPILLGLSGPSRSGKTYSALRVATGLKGDGPVAMIDTESGRGLHYAETFDYIYAALPAPFSSDRYLAAIMDAKEAGASVIIVDSASHEHEGPGGMLEQHETELHRMAGDDWKKRQKVTFTAWIKPKAAHNKYVNALLQMGAETHFIFCFRAKEKLIIKTGQEPVSAGLQPICSSRFEYEMTSMLMLPENSKGHPDLAAPATGLREPFDTYCRPGFQLDEAFGKRLREWASPRPAKQPDLAPTDEKKLALKALGDAARKADMNADDLLRAASTITETDIGSFDVIKAMSADDITAIAEEIEAHHFQP